MYEPYLLVRGRRLAKSSFRLKKILSILLIPFGVFFGIIGLVRRWLYKNGWLNSYPSTLTTIGIGNLTVGGTGKTPMVEYLLRLLKDEHRVATLSRGYKRETEGYLNSTICDTVDACTFGDEPAQLHEKFPDIQVVVCEKREEALRRLEHVAQRPEVVLLDDAYQHLQVRCSLNLLLTDFSRLYCDDFPMPSGRLREFPLAASAADAVIVTKSPGALTPEEAEKIRMKLKVTDTQSCFFTTLVYDELTPVTPTAQQLSPSPSSPVILLTGIANPKPMHQEISKRFTNIETISYRDHHTFTDKEIESLCQKIADKRGGAIIITTEKDGVRLRDRRIRTLTDKLPIFVLPVRVKFLFGDEERFNKMVKGIWK